MNITIVDDLNPEDTAMLQALYSRSAESVSVHLEKVRASGSGNFMSKFYVGYGHKSIADCGSTTIFIEGVSLLAAKAIQDWPLYSGQETSTRYIDMGAQRVIEPAARHNGGEEIIADWMNFYRDNQERVEAVVRNTHPPGHGEDLNAYARAVKARAFDILRGFLPAGVTTQLSWHTNLRQAGDHLAWLACHPLAEVRRIAENIRVQLQIRYPSSGAGMSLPQVSGVSGRDDVERAEREAWLMETAFDWTYPAPKADSTSNYLHVSSNINPKELPAKIERLLRDRPRGCVLPHFLTDLGQVHLYFDLDFGSFRDFQRHRNGVVRMPVLDTSGGFEHWYLDQLGPPDGELRKEAVALIRRQQDRIARLDLSAFGKQYYTALGFRVYCQAMFSLPALVYLLELRSSKTVHPTLRSRVLRMIERIEAMLPVVRLHVDRSPDDWTVRRGTQTITEKP